MFAFAYDVSNPAAPAKIGSSARNLLARLLHAGPPAAPAAPDAAAHAGRAEASIPYLPAATNYMAWRS
jgi:hypothetical protein